MPWSSGLSMAAALLTYRELHLYIKTFMVYLLKYLVYYLVLMGWQLLLAALLSGASAESFQKKLLQAAVVTALTATSLLLVMTIIEGPLAMIVILIFIYMITMGMILTSTFTLGMAKQGHRAGSASAVLGMLPLLLGSIFSPLAGINEASAVPMGTILFVTTLIGFIAFFTLVKKIN